MCQRPPDTAYPATHQCGQALQARLAPEDSAATGVTSVGAVVDKEIGQAGLREHGAGGFLAAQIALASRTRAL